jgi:hypothetical protein
MKEEVELIDGSKAEVNCRYLLPRKAYQIFRSLVNITAEDFESKTAKVELSGIVELIPFCVDEVVADCPQKEKITIKSMKEIYSKYAEKTMGEVMASVDPKFVDK